MLIPFNYVTDGFLPNIYSFYSVKCKATEKPYYLSIISDESRLFSGCSATIKSGFPYCLKTTHITINLVFSPD